MSASGEGGFSSRLAALKRKVSQSAASAKDSNPEDAKRRKLVEAKRKRDEERKRRAAAGEAEKTSGRAGRLAKALRVRSSDYQMAEVKIGAKPFREDAIYEYRTMECGDRTAVLKDLKASSRRYCDAVSFSQTKEYILHNASGRSGFAAPCLDLIEGEDMHVVLHQPESDGVAFASAEEVRGCLGTCAAFLKAMHNMEPTGLTAFPPWNVFVDIMDFNVALRKAAGLQADSDDEDGGSNAAAAAAASAVPAAKAKLVLPASYDALYATAMQFMEILSESHADSLSASYVCHNFLRYDRLRLVRDGPRGETKRIVATDFTRASLGDRYYDLASFSRLNGLSDDDDTVLLQHYFGSYTKRQLACFRLLKLAGLLRDAMDDLLAHHCNPAHPQHSSLLPAAHDGFEKFDRAANDAEFVAYISDELFAA